jgi:hypothetical protein
LDGDAIVIIDENDKRQIWDYEADHLVAESIAREIEIGLRSISYTKSKLLELFEDVTDGLLENGVPADMMDWIIGDAYYDVSKILPDLLTRLVHNSKNR